MAPTTPLFDPDRYFTRERPPLRTALLAVVAFWLAMIGFLLALAWHVMEAAPEFPQASLSELVPIVAIIMGVSLALVWVLEAALLHGITRVVGGSGAFGSTLVITAWGFVPQAIAVLFQAAMLPFETPAEPITAEDPAVIAEQFAAGAPLAVTVVSFVTLAAMTLWVVYIWTYGLARVHDVTIRRAAIAAVGVAVIVPLALNVF